MYICVLSQCIWYWINSENINMCTYHIQLLHRLFWFFKKSKVFSVSLYKILNIFFWQICNCTRIMQDAFFVIFKTFRFSLIFSNIPDIELIISNVPSQHIFSVDFFSKTFVSPLLRAPLNISSKTVFLKHLGIKNFWSRIVLPILLSVWLHCSHERRYLV